MSHLHVCRSPVPLRRAVAGVALAAAVAAGVAPARADDGPPPNYVGLFVGTTLIYRPPGGPADGPQGDPILSFGYGRQLTPELALELDVAAVFDGDRDFVAVAFVPSAVYGFRPNLYAAMRLIIPTPLIEGGGSEWNLALLPGLGAYWPGVVTPTLELDALSFVGRGDPDVGVQLTAGAIYGF